jgi:RNA recognition motif-containing protein
LNSFFFILIKTTTNKRPCRVIGVFGLSYNTVERDVEDVFGKYGRVERIKLVTNPNVSSFLIKFNPKLL